MKVATCLVLLFALAYGKRELKSGNCKGRSVISHLDGIWDSKGGPIDRNSKLTIQYTTNQDTSGRDPFDLNIKISLAKYMVFGYVPIPQGIMDSIGKNLAKASKGEIQYLGRSTLRVKCMFKRLVGHCLPPKGKSKHTRELRQLADSVKQGMGRQAYLANGWFKMSLDARTSFKQTAFCIQGEFKLQLT